eukprot:TRINITY_DN4186_c0_g1_i1.p1 TRINITY_DN4186_c0_g1~~TRINITY_DN4186_c0_g1_i1.p1  ORF type:complete len:368 (-),score=57.03 TRINITY_DN4186_c0_g1_i1:361-1464(-)
MLTTLSFSPAPLHTLKQDLESMAGVRSLTRVCGEATRIARQASCRLHVVSRHVAPDQTIEEPGTNLGSSGRTGRGYSTGVFGSALCGAAFASGTAVAFSSAAASSETAPQEVPSALDPNEFRKFKLQEAIKVSHNSSIYRFSIDPEATVGLHVASCLVTRAPIGDDGAMVIRPYTPISYPDAKGHFDLLIKVYPDGKMSSHFAGLKPGDVVEMKGPIPKLKYEQNMKRQIGMIAGGTGITPMLQVIDAVLRNPEDNTQVTLLFANQSPGDVLLKDRLDELQASHPNFKVYYVVGNPDPKWVGGVGFLTKGVLQKALPSPDHDPLVLVCGPPGMMNAMSGNKAPDKSQGELSGLLKDLGYTKEQVYKF